MVNMEPKSAQSPLPKVIEFNAADISTEDVIRALRTAGGVIVRQLIPPEQNHQIERDVRPWLQKDKPWQGDFFPPETRRAYGMMGKSRTFAEAIVGNRLWTEVCDALLTSVNRHNWVGDKTEESVSGPQLMNTIVFSIGPGARAQELHRDDANHHQDLRAVAEHQLGRDTGIGLFVAGKRTTKQNGATRFIPGSHLWDYREGPAREDQAFYAELEAGDAFMMLSGCFHGGSANRTADEERLVYSTFMTRGYLRQEENQYLANDTEAIKKLPVWLQERMGYGISRPFLGWVDLESPMALLHSGDAAYQQDLW
ncbi:hypothetical protein LTR36_000011 [Oleoguttula mirabilis]|uniref:Phytanoyl-CoA dioxygenase n=1 Tax=Oleoguttula mirabilis TaxID=1507867 RepID=A0AAV9JY04_9PEZI|nr:hypothetical protein LTR36_000011 [Oleoguttula mirabilis]